MNTPGRPRGERREAQPPGPPAGRETSWPPLPLPAAIRQRFVEPVNGLRLHLLEAGEPGRPCLLLLHGFPELAYSWRKLMPPLAAAGWHVLAPDQRGYGRSSGFDTAYDTDLQPFGLRNLVRDAVALLDALGIARAAAVVGHDFGAPVAAWCALLHPERFASVALMSAPFGGPPATDAGGEIHAALAALPRPRKHYQRHYATREANEEMWHCPQGVHAFLRAYYHMKSADWPGNRPHELQGWRADELAQMPEYYIMELHQGMAQAVAAHLPAPARVAACRWLTEDELAVYAAEFGRTGFQGGLQWYRCSTHPPCVAELQASAGRTIDVPACFIAGASDWGMFQKPGELQRMRSACTRLRGVHVVPGAGHWVQQEQPDATLRLLRGFLAGAE
jgi:pimeloyl-ACP methyl ester carboxylesterase